MTHGTPRDWRSHLTPDERKRIAKIDAEIKRLKGLIVPIRFERMKIQCRASGRAGRQA